MDATPLPAPGQPPRRLPKRLLAMRADEGLVARVRDGDEAAFEVLYERYASGILSFCRHMLGSQAEAEDAAQQTFASAYRDLLRDEREIRLKPWLYTIARNRCLSMLRARREEREELEVSVAGLGDEVQRRAELRELLADLHDLPPYQRAALVLTELGDLSHAEVADVLDCEVANVKGLVFRARSGLIERRDAREAPCAEIREELATARRGALRKGRLRHHLKACCGCSAFLDDVRRQRQMLGVALPVVPTLAFKKSVLAAAGLGGGGAAAGGGGLAAGGLASGATLAKAAAVVVIAGSGATAGTAVLDSSDAPPADVPAAAPARGDLPSSAKDDAPRGRPGAPGERSASDRGARGRERGRTRGRGRKRGHSKNAASKAKRRGPKNRGNGRRALTPAGPKPVRVPKLKPVPPRSVAPLAPPARLRPPAAPPPKVKPPKD